MGSAQQQGIVWGARAQDWAEANEPAWAEVFGAVLDEAGVRPGRTLLDIGCGAGGALVAARARGAVVAGLDASEALVDVARRRLPGAVLEVGEMEALPFADGSFDLVTAINAVQFAEDPTRALGEARRVVRTGGTVAVLAWGPRERCDMLSRIGPVLMALLPPAAPASGPAARSFSADGVIEEHMAAAGLTPVRRLTLSGILGYPDRQTAARGILAAAARAIAHSGEARVRDAVMEALGPLTDGSGAVRLQNQFHLVLGERRL